MEGHDSLNEKKILAISYSLCKRSLTNSVVIWITEQAQAD
jgi:hypothetical protein